MSLATLLFKQKTLTTMQRTVAGKTVTLSLDVLTSESLSADADPTTNPVEVGADVTDHVILKPKKLTIKGEVTETPFTLQQRLQGLTSVATGAASQALTNLTGTGGFGALAGRQAQAAANKAVGGLLGTTTDNRKALVMKELENARVSKTPVTMITGLTRYENYILTNYTVDRSSASNKIGVSLALQECIVATSLTVKVPVPKKRAGVPKANQGRQKASELAGEQGNNGSLAYKTLKGLGVIK